LVAEGANINDIDNQMENYGVYRLKNSQNNQIKLVPASTGVVDMSAPSIWYDSSTNEWDVVAGGSYNFYSWMDDAAFSLTSGWNNMGGVDTVGFSLNSTYGSYNGVSCIGGYAYITDHNGRSSNVTSPLTNDYSKGIYFLFQDQVYYDSFLNPIKYYGEGFSALGRYTSKFSNYHGNCDGFYGHTWAKTGVSSVSLTNSGFSINFNSAADNTPYNSFDTSF
jgi:hypothetical protein